MSDTPTKIDSILNPPSEKIFEEQENLILGDFHLDQEVLGQGEIVVDLEITEVSIIDLKGKHFKFPGSFSMVREGGRVTFVAKG
jgi:hypothetical protein